MSNFFIAVGGTGQNIALAYLRLVKSCGIVPADIYLMDSDNGGDISKKLREALHQDTIPSISPISKRKNITYFRNIFKDAEYQDNIDTALSLLFTDEQLDIEVSKGMYCCPPVGASALHEKFKRLSNDSKDSDWDKSLNTLITDINAKSPGKVVICGSVCGGTGAGGVPTISQHLKQQFGNNVQILIIDFLRWFYIKERQDYNEMLERNQESGVFYLEDKIAREIDACVLLGTELPVKTDYRDIGSQTEIVHFINLIGAVIANNFFNVNNYDALFPVPNKFYSYIIPDKGLDASKLEVMFDGRTMAINKVLKIVTAIEKLLKFFENYINGGLPGFSFTPWLTVPENLKRAIISLMMNQGWNVKATCEKIYKQVEQERKYHEELKEWFEKLASSGEFIIGGNETEITADSYKKIIENPMPFFRECINDSDISGVKDVKELVDKTIKEMRKKIDELYLS